MNWREKVAVVTGASSGIGRVTAKAFAERGAVVVAVARRAERLEELVLACRKTSPESGYLAGDLGQRAFAVRVVEETVERHGRIDVLVNNAAMPKHKHVYDVSLDEADRVMDVNFRSCMWTTLTAIPHMLREGGGSVVNVSSFAGRVAPPRETLYAASKFAMNGFSEGLWHDLEGSNIHVALILPGAIDTEIWDKAESPHVFAGRKARPEVVTEAIFEAIEKRRHEIVVPKRRPDLAAASLLRLLAPGLLRRGMRRYDPVGAEVVERARRRRAAEADGD